MFKRHTQETLSEGDLTVPQLTALSLFIGSALNPINSSLIATALVPITLPGGHHGP